MFRAGMNKDLRKRERRVAQKAKVRDEIMEFHKNLTPFLKDGALLCVGEPMDFLSDSEVTEFLRKLGVGDPEILADLD